MAVRAGRVAVNTRQHVSDAGRRGLERLWVEKSGQRAGEDGEESQTHPSPIPSFAAIGPLNVSPVVFLFVSGVRLAGWIAEVNIVASFNERRLTGEEGGKGDREGGMRSGEDGLRSKGCFDNLIVRLFFHPACRDDEERKEREGRTKKRFR